MRLRHTQLSAHTDPAGSVALAIYHVISSGCAALSSLAAFWKAREGFGDDAGLHPVSGVTHLIL